MVSAIQPSFSKGEVSPRIYGRVDTAAYQVALKTALNLLVQAAGGVTKRPGFYYISPTRGQGYDPRLVRFEFRKVDTLLIEFGNQYIRFYRDDFPVVETTKTITGITNANPAVVTSNAHGYSNGDDIYVMDVAGMTQVNGRWFKVANVTTNTYSLKDPITSVDINSTSYSAYVSGGTSERAYTIASPYTTAELEELNFVQDKDVLTVVHKNHEQRELRRTALTNWALSTITFTPSIAAPTSPNVTVNSGGSTTYKYKVTSQKDTGEESLPTAEITAASSNTVADNTLTWTAATGAVRYNVYKLMPSGGVFGYIGTTDTTTFTDKNLAAEETDTPPAARTPLNATNKYPGAVGYYEQRRVFGGTYDDPDNSYFSVTGSHSNLSVSEPLKDDDAITARLPSQGVNEIRHYLPLNDLLVFTSDSEWRVNSGPDSYFSASTIKQKPQSRWGCSWLAPTIVGTTALYVDGSQSKVRSLGFSLQVDGYTGSDMTLLSEHLFRKRSQRIVGFAGARYPDNVMHAVRDDGILCSMTFQQEQEVVGWARWRTKGQFRRVATLPPDPGEQLDRLYVVTRRWVNGVWARYVERLLPGEVDDVRDAYYVDCGLTYDAPTAIESVSVGGDCVVNITSHGLADGTKVDLSDIEWEPDEDEVKGEIQPDQLNNRRYTVTQATANSFKLLDDEGEVVDATEFNAYVSGGNVRVPQRTFSGLWHLEGVRVIALCDGNVIDDENLVVQNGSLTFSRAYSRVHIGLPYTADLETLDREFNPSSPVTGKMKNISQVGMKLYKSRGYFYGSSFSEKKMKEAKQRRYEAYDQPTELSSEVEVRTFDPTWNNHGRVCIRAPYPLPFTVQAIIPDYTLEEGDRRGD